MMSTEVAPRAAVPFRREVDTEMVARIGVTSTLLGAAAVHSTVMEHHYAAWALAGIFFLVLQITQTVLAIAVVLFWRSTTALAVVLVSMGAIAVWVISRTVGVPFAPVGFARPEAVGSADLACFILALAATAMALPWALQGRTPGNTLHRVADKARTPLTTRRAVPAAVLVVLASVAVTVFGLLPNSAGAQHPVGHHGPADQTATSHGEQEFSR